MTLDARSERNLVGVHPDLVRVIHRAHALAVIAEVPFVVIEGLRTIERQRELYRLKKTQTLKSRHLTGHAIDVMEAGGTWPFAIYKRIAAVIKGAAQEIGVPIEWGGDWLTFKDGPHYQLPTAQYP